MTFVDNKSNTKELVLVNSLQRIPARIIDTKSTIIGKVSTKTNQKRLNCYVMTHLYIKVTKSQVYYFRFVPFSFFLTYIIGKGWWNKNGNNFRNLANFSQCCNTFDTNLFNGIYHFAVFTSIVSKSLENKFSTIHSRKVQHIQIVLKKKNNTKALLK